MWPTNEPVLPPLDGSVNFAEAVDFNLENNPNQPFFVFAPLENPHNLVYISHLEFSRACHRVAHLFRPNRTGNDRQVVAILGLADTLVYQTVVLGIMRAGWVPFPISSRNTAPAVLHLLRESKCHKVIATERKLKSLFADIKSALEDQDTASVLDIQEMPTIDILYPHLGNENADEHPFTPYPAETPRPPMDTLAMYLHSSGSTGYPKVIPQTFKIFAEWSNYSCKVLRDIRDPRIRYGGMALPPFHTMGISIHLLYPVLGIICICLYPPVVHSLDDLPIMPTSDNVMQHMRWTGADVTITVPALLHQWVQSNDAIEMLKRFRSVTFAGGPLLPEVGAKLYAAGVKLGSLYGTTEIGGPSLLNIEKTPEEEAEWEWIKFSDRCTLDWENQGNGTYECRFLTSDICHPSVENMIDHRGYATSDVFVKHPTIPDLWKIVGRKDDVIIHSSGEKTVPGPIEEMIQNRARDLIAGIVMFGRKHDQAGILVEPSPDVTFDRSTSEGIAAFRNAIWPAVEEANKIAPTFSRIYKEMILIATPEKPLPRSEKGAVARKAALKIFDAEIEDLYNIVDLAAAGDATRPPSNWDVDNLAQWLIQQATEILSVTNISPSTNLFEQGFDSLSATFLRLRIAKALQASNLARVLSVITQNIVYDLASIDHLAQFISSRVNHPIDDLDDTLERRKAAVEAMIQKYSSDLDGQLPPPTTSAIPQRTVVLVTGTTGNIGSHILSMLLLDDSVSAIYTFNRPGRNGETSLQRHEQRFKEHELDCKPLLSHKVKFFEGEAGDKNLGLTEVEYRELNNSVTHIVHGAWHLDLNLSLQSFESNIRGTRNLIDFALTTPFANRIRFVFLSSVASAEGWDKSCGPYPEEHVDEVSYSLGIGYGESKYVSEKILAKSGLQASSLRIGQVSGGLPNGAWATSDWFPIMVKTSLSLGALPDCYGLISWMPMDVVARIVLDITFTPDSIPFALNIVHPRPISWTEVILAVSNALCTRLPTREKLSIVNITEWVERLEGKLRAATKDVDIENIPAVKLIDLYRRMAEANTNWSKGSSRAESGGLPSFETKKAQSISETMRAAKPIGHEDAIRWVNFWCCIGFIG